MKFNPLGTLVILHSIVLICNGGLWAILGLTLIVLQIRLLVQRREEEKAITLVKHEPINIRIAPQAITPRALTSTSINGDVSCRYNANSPLLRCAVNPKGDCFNCNDYEKR